MGFGLMEHLKIGIIFLQLFKLLVNGCVVVMYRVGDSGHFMGASYNRNHDAESFVGGVFVGYFVFNIAQLISHIFIFMYDRENKNKPMIVEVIMTVLGGLLWVIAGAVSLQFWKSFIAANQFTSGNPKVMGLVMGSLGIVVAGIYMVEVLLTWVNYKSNYKNPNRRRSGGNVYSAPTRFKSNQEMEQFNKPM